MSEHDDRWSAAEEIAELLRDGDQDAAIALGETLIEQDPKNEYAFFFLGCAHFEKGNHPKALRAFVSALDLEPNYLGAMVHLGHTLRMLGRNEEAIRVGKQILTRASEDGDGLHVLGLAHLARGDNAAALRYLERYLATHPEVEAAMEVRGIVQMLRGEIGLSADDPDLEEN